MKTAEQKFVIEQARFRRHLRTLTPEEQVFAKALRQQTIYAADYSDYGHRHELHNFASDWKSKFRTPPPPEALERFAAARLEIYKAAAKCGKCGCRAQWLEDDTREALSTGCKVAK